MPVIRIENAERWRQVNQQHKMAEHELLALTAGRDQTLAASWLDPKTGRQDIVTLACTDGQFPSLTPILPELSWDEREIHDLFGYVPTGHPDLRPLVRNPRWPQSFRPLRSRPAGSVPWRDLEPDNPATLVEGEGITVMKVGPTHAGIIESGHFVFSLMGENVLYLDAHLFQNHRGVEAELEGLALASAAPLISRICAADTVSHQTNWASAVEALAQYEPSDDLILRRIVLLEAERILSHLNDLAQIPAGVGFQVAHQRALTMKEYWQQGLKRLFGHRFLFDTVRPGGAAEAPCDDLIRLFNGLRQTWTPWRKLVEGHHGFNDRMTGVGTSHQTDAVRMGAQGVAARAAGKSFDARTILPLYRQFSIVPVIEPTGDVKARFLVRLNEVEESLSLLEDAVTRLRRHAQNKTAWSAPQNLSGQVVTYTESPHGLNVHVVTLSDGRVDRYHIRAATYRNWPFLAATVAGNAVADFPLINKSFELCYSCTDR
jgi:Ni,Fe-hydrogenase III large subunit